jgi:hypothetical protein
MPDYPLRHLSIRVPWHDTGWTGKVCEAPDLNGACAKLKRISYSKSDRPDYRARWEKKLALYRASGIHPLAEAQPGAPILITTNDTPTSGLDMATVKKLITDVCVG